MPHFNAFYAIHIYDTTGTRQLVLDQYAYLEFSQIINSPWNHIIRVEAGYDDELTTFFRETMTRDWIIEVYRTSPFDGEVDLVYEGFNRTIVDQIKKDGTVVFTLYGVGYTQLLKRRIVLPDPGVENSKKTGVAGTIMKAFVDDQCITPLDLNRVIPGLSNATTGDVGATAEYSARYTILFTVIDKLAEQGGVDFGVHRDTTVGTFQFEVRSLWGTDRTIGNTAGDNPVIFDLGFNNMDIPILSFSGDDEVNYVYIGGQGEGVSRVIQTLETTSAIAVSPWNRQEAFVDSRQESTNDGLLTNGQSYLNQHGYLEKLSFNIVQNEGTQWLRDWFLGDIASALYGGKRFDKKIVKINVVVSGGSTGQAIEEVINAETEDA